MDLQNMNKVTTLEDYVKLTTILLADEYSKRFQLNVVTVRTLINLRSLELKYFNKVHAMGAASLILDRILQESWPASLLEDGVCANELVLLIKYWLEYIRKHLTMEKPHWWKFLNILLDFIQKLPSHTTILTALVQHVGASVLELVTRDEVPIEARHKLLICFKKISVAPREVRTEHKDKFDRYVQELARYMSSCGDVCLQFVMVEVLPREDVAVRRDVAARWLTPALYSREAVRDFVTRDWKCFIRDTRNFLNVHNKSNKNVVSILCYRLRVGNAVIKSSTRQRWLDINIGTKRLSLMLDKPLYLAMNISKEEESYLAALHITEGNTEMVKMTRFPIKGSTIEIKVIDPLQMFPTPFLEGKHCVTMYFTAEIDVNKVDNALRAIFDSKYTFTQETGSLPMSRQDSSRISEIITDVETRFSNPPELLGRKPLGSKPPHASTSAFSSVNFEAYESRLSAESQSNITNNAAVSEEHHNFSSLRKIVAEPLLDPKSFKSPNSENTDRRKGKNFGEQRNLSPELRVSVERDTVIDLLAQEVFDQLPRSFLSTNPKNREKVKSPAKERENFNRNSKIPIDKDIIVDQLAQEALDQLPRSLLSTNPKNRENVKSPAKEQENFNRNSKIPIDKDIIVDQLAQEALDQLPRSLRSTNAENTHRGGLCLYKSLAKEPENLNRDCKIPIDKDIIVDRLSQEAFEYLSQNDNISFQRNNVSSFTNAETNNVTIRQKHENGQHNRPLRRVIDESNTSFIENTYPTIDLKSKFEKEKFINEASKDGNFRQPILDDKTIETYFSQHFYEQKDIILAISPTLAKKINVSGASRNSVHLCSPPVLVDNEKQRNELNTNKGLQKETKPLEEITNINCEKKALPTSKKIKSLKLIFNKNHKMPKVSKTDSLPKKRRKSAKPVIDENDNEDINENRESSKVSTNEVIEIPLIKRVSKTDSLPKKRRKSAKPVIDENDNEAINENRESSKVSTDEVIETPLIKRVSKTDLLPKKRKKSPKTVLNEKEKNSKVSTEEEIVTPLTKRRRKLYSERDDDLLKEGIRISETEEETRDSALAVRENVQANPKTAATPYTELERIRKNRTVRTFFKRKSSPRKEDLFDQLRATVENTNIVLVDMKNVRKNDVFNFTSGSETDNDFKTDTRTEKREFRRRKDAEFLRPRSKVSKRTRSKSKMQSKMVDERMRKADTCFLNTSIVQESSCKETVTEVEPIHNKPRVDMLPECIDSDKETTTAKKSRKRNKKIVNERNTKQDNHTSSDSSLPALIIEREFTEPTHSVINLETLNKNSYENLYESNLAQDILKESEQVNDSLKVNTAINRSQSMSSDIISHKHLSVVLNKFDIHNEKSISTTGNSPITAHGVHDESPPKLDEINKTISPRGLEAEGFSDKARGYYDRLLKDMDSSSEKRKRSKTRKKPMDKILCVSVPRLPLSELRKYSRESHEVKTSASQDSIHQATLSELPETNNTKTKVGTSTETSPCLSRKPIRQPISLESSTKPQVKENVHSKIGNTDSLASKSLKVKENHPSKAQPRQDGSAEGKSLASNIYEWFQRNESAEPRTEDTIKEMLDAVMHKIETWREIDHNGNLRLISLLGNVASEQEKLNSELRLLYELLYDKLAELDVLVQRKEALIAEFMNRSSDIFRRKNQESAESFRQLLEEIQAFRPRAHDADVEGV